MSPSARISERRLLFLVGAVQAVNILDFMMVMPLGPDFAQALGIPTSHIGWIGGSYTVAAAFSGILGAFFLDRFDRRVALVASMVGLGLATALGGLATDMTTLMYARVSAGTFGGPATAVALSIVSDCVPPERRGRAMGVVMGAFSMAAVLGVPFALKLATWGDWRYPFWAVGGLCLVVAAFARLACPSLRGHLANGLPPIVNPLRVLSSPTARVSLSTTVTVFAASFAVVPNIAAYLQFNLGWPRADMDLLYGIGGLVTFFTMRGVGRLVDRFGATRIASLGTFVLAGDLALIFLQSSWAVPVLALFVGFMVGQSTRTVALNALASRVPAPDERARFLSAQSAVQHIASSIGAFLSARLLTADTDHRLVGMDRVAMIAIGLVLLQPPLMRLVEGRLNRREVTS